MKKSSDNRGHGGKKSCTKRKKKNEEMVPEGCAAVFCRKEGDDTEWIMCDSCTSWYHFRCVGLTQMLVQNIVTYECSRCTAERSRLQTCRDNPQKDCIIANLREQVQRKTEQNNKLEREISQKNTTIVNLREEVRRKTEQNHQLERALLEQQVKNQAGLQALNTSEEMETPPNSDDFGLLTLPETQLFQSEQSIVVLAGENENSRSESLLVSFEKLPDKELESCSSGQSFGVNTKTNVPDVDIQTPMLDNAPTSVLTVPVPIEPHEIQLAKETVQFTSDFLASTVEVEETRGSLEKDIIISDKEEEIINNNERSVEVEVGPPESKAEVNLSEMTKAEIQVHDEEKPEVVILPNQNEKPSPRQFKVRPSAIGKTFSLPSTDFRKHQLKIRKISCQTSVGSVKRDSQSLVVCTEQARSASDTSDNDCHLPLKSRKMSLPNKQIRSTKRISKSTSNMSVVPHPQSAPTQIVDPRQYYGNFTQYPPNSYFNPFGAYSPQICGSGAVADSIIPKPVAANESQKMPMFPLGVWPPVQQNPYCYPFGFPPYGNPDFSQPPTTNPPLESSHTLAISSSSQPCTGSIWNELKGPAGQIVLDLSNEFLDDLLRKTEHDLKNNFDCIIKRLKYKFRISSDIGIATQIYEKVLTQSIEPSDCLFTEVEKKLIAIVMKLSTAKLSSSGRKILEKLPRRLIDYFKTQVIPNGDITFEQEDKGLERVGRFYGALCRSMNLKIEIKDLIFEAMYWRPPHAFALTLGILQVDNSHYNNLPFEKFDVKDRGILFTLKNPPRFNDAKMYWNLRDLLINSFEIKLPSLTFNGFVENILVEIQGYESAVELERASKVLAMFLIQGGIKWTTKFIEKSLATCIQNWRDDKITDQVLVTVIRAIGYFCRDSMEPRNLTGLKEVFEKLAKVVPGTPAVIAKAVTECVNNITSKMNHINTIKKNGVTKQWEWCYSKYEGD